MDTKSVKGEKQPAAKPAGPPAGDEAQLDDGDVLEPAPNADPTQPPVEVETVDPQAVADDPSAASPPFSRPQEEAQKFTPPDPDVYDAEGRPREPAA